MTDTRIRNLGACVGEKRGREVTMTQKKYTFSVCCSFTIQHTFDESEIELDPGGDGTDVEPTDRALLALARELEEVLSAQYSVSDFDASSDSDMLLGTVDEGL